MEKIRIGDLCDEKIDNISIKRVKDIDYIDISSINNITKQIEGYSTMPIKGAPSRAKQLLKRGDILVSTVRPNLNAVAVCNIESKNALVGSTGFCVLRPRDNVDSKYLFYFCQSMYFINELMDVATGASYPAVSKQDVKNVLIPNYSVSNQVNILNRIDKIAEIIRKRKIQLDRLDELVKSRFVEMFGDPEENPKRHCKRKLADLSIKVSDGVHAKPEYIETGRPFLSVVNINKKKVDFTDCKYVSEESYQKMIKSTRPEKGDVLYTKVGATYGIPAYIDTNREFCLYVSVCLIKPRHELINARFLALEMDMPYVKHQADRRIKGIGVPDLHLNQIREFDILCPPRNEQESFVDFVAQVDKSKVVVQKALDEAQLLYDSLMQKYFG